MDWAAHMRRILVQLGEDATITGVTDPVRGVFLEPYKDINGGMIESSDPRFACMSADVAGVAQGTAITVHASNWTIAAREPNSTSGLVELTLTKA